MPLSPKKNTSKSGILLVILDFRFWILDWGFSVHAPPTLGRNQSKILAIAASAWLTAILIPQARHLIEKSTHSKKSTLIEKL